MCAVDLTDSKRKVLYLPAPHFLVRPTTLHCCVYFQVNNGVWSFLDYVEDIRSAGRPLRFLQIYDSNLLVLSLHILVPHSSCVYVHNL